MRKQAFFWVAIFLQLNHFGFSQSMDVKENDTDSSGIITMNGYVRGSSFLGGELYDFADLFSEFKFNAEARFERVCLKSDIRFRTGSRFNELYNEIEIKELYGTVQNDQFQLSIGNQIIEWGRTDGFNPTNNLSPKNYFFLSGDMDDQLLSNFMARLKYTINTRIELDLVLTPLYRPSLYRFDLIPINENVHFTAFSQPELRFKNMGFAGRLNADYPFAGLSFSYFNGFSTFHGFDKKEVLFDPTNGSMTILNEPKPYRKQTFGFDLAVPTSLLILRGEAAYNLTSDKEVGIYIPKDDVQYVIGLEKEILGLRLIFQYIGKYTLDFESISPPDVLNYDPGNPLEQIRFALDLTDYEMTLFNRKLFGQQYEFGHAISGFISRSFAFDVVNAELACMYDFQTEEWMLRPKVTWQVNDHVRVGIGGSYLEGPEKSLFQYSKGIMNGFFGDFRVYF